MKSHTSEEGFVTFIGSNFDHNVATLDGKGTFHGTGINAAITNKGRIKMQHVIRERPKTMVKVADLINRKGEPITSYVYPNSGLETISSQPCRELLEKVKNPCSLFYDRLWHAADLFTAADMPRPR